MQGSELVSKYIKGTFWIIKKNTQVWVRSHLSHVLALILSVLVLIREGHEIKSIFFSIANLHFSFSAFELLIIILTIGTIGAAIWEFKGNKLATSPQELRFVVAMRLLLLELEKFAYGTDKEPEVEKRLEDFIQYFLDITCETLCGEKEVAGALMIALHADGPLILDEFKSSNAKYPSELCIPMFQPFNTEETGPAGVCFYFNGIVYMPYKKWKLAWPYKLIYYDEEGYEPLDAQEGWVEAPSPDLENFCSVLCLPVAIYEDKELKQNFGVLNYSTAAHDPFVYRDFIMGECFSSILAQAIAIARAEYMQK